MTATPSTSDQATLIKGALALVIHALDRLGAGESFNQVIESTGVTARLSELLAQLNADPLSLPIATSVSPGPSGSARPMRADYVRVARVFAEAYGKHDEAPAYLPRTAEAAAKFEPDAWVVAAMMQAYHDGASDGAIAEGARIATKASTIGTKIAAAVDSAEASLQDGSADAPDHLDAIRAMAQQIQRGL